MAAKKSKLKGVNILLAVTGGVAAYKAVDLASKLTSAGAVVNTIMTAGACRFVQPKSFEAVTARPVNTSLWDSTAGYEISHISAADTADIVVVAPATANIIAKVAGGICDDLVSTVLCACWQKPILFAPAMNDKMWSNPAVKWNTEALKNMGFEMVGPEKGRLACGTDGTGRMSEPVDILARIEKLAAKTKK
ncbi:MAG: hypothetical protein K8R02_02555 [Anaerohalosphaeraceae bacterium]|nr:hypothetical protein [Anaerohalosphaeraceae bacterium]